MTHNNPLGKGLGAILPDLINDLDTMPQFIMCGIEELYPNRFSRERTLMMKIKNNLSHP